MRPIQQLQLVLALDEVLGGRADQVGLGFEAFEVLI